MREAQQLFAVDNGFAEIFVPIDELPVRVLAAYKALLMELARIDLLKKAQSSRVVINPIYAPTELSKNEYFFVASFPELVKRFLTIGLSYSLETDPPGVGHTSLVTSYRLTRPVQDLTGGSWCVEISLPSQLLKYLAFKIAQRRDWIERCVLPIVTAEEECSLHGARKLNIRCAP